MAQSGNMWIDRPMGTISAWLTISDWVLQQGLGMAQDGRARMQSSSREIDKLIEGNVSHEYFPNYFPNP